MGKRPDVKVKRLMYRRASWTNQKKETLENVLKICHNTYGTTAERTFKGLYGTELQCAKYSPKDKVGLLFQIASCVPGQPTSAIQESSQSTTTSGITEVPAPAGSNFLDGDVFVLINGNNVIILQSGVRESVALNYFSKMLDKNGYTEASISLEFHGIVQEDKIKMIKSQGVKSIELDASLYEASLMQIEKETEKKRETKVIDLPGAVAETLKQVFAKDKSLKEISENENVNIKLSIRFDGRKAMRKANKKDASFGVVGKSRLEKASEMIVKECVDEQYEGFTIVTGDNNRIKSGEIVVSDNYRVKTYGNSLDQEDAFEKLQDYFAQLQDRGTLSK